MSFDKTEILCLKKSTSVFYLKCLIVLDQCFKSSFYFLYELLLTASQLFESLNTTENCRDNNGVVCAGGAAACRIYTSTC